MSILSRVLLFLYVNLLFIFISFFMLRRGMESIIILDQILRLARHMSTANSIQIVEGGVQLGPLGNPATNRPTVPTLSDYDDGNLAE
jgi:hypothetical protein